MDFITYPVNKSNPGSIIPILFGIQWGLQSSENSFIAYIDQMSRAREYVFDLRQWFIEKGFTQCHFLQNKNHDLPLNFFDHFKKGIKLKIHEGPWYKCKCGKVEFLDKTILTQSYRRFLKLINNQNKCLLCGSEIVLSVNRGLIVKLPHVKQFSLKQAKIYPNNLVDEVQYWVDFFSGRYILLSRQRETSYKIKYQGESFYLDPTMYDIFSTFLEKNTCVITGRDAIIAYALGFLFFDISPIHIFLPRFEINNWNEILHLNFDELVLLFIGNMNWSKNKVKINMSDLKFIRKNKINLEKKLDKTLVSDIQDITLFNRNFYSL